MWDRSYRWQRLARVGTGIAACGAMFVGLAAFSSTDAAARAADGVAEISREASPDRESTVMCTVPNELGVRVGGLVYREGKNGEAEIVGRVIKAEPRDSQTELTILLTPAAAGAMSTGGKLRGAAPTDSVEHAFRLIISPDIPREEAKIARDTLWPAIEKHVLPPLKVRITKEVTESFDDLDPEDRELLDTTITDLRLEMTELEEQLLNRLANRAWEVIGVSGVAEGVLRKAKDGAGNSYEKVKGWVKGIFGGENAPDEANSDFLTPERAAALRIALEQEVEAFLQENDKEIKEKFNVVLNKRRADFVAKFEQKWGPKLYENALVPSWLEGEEGVLEAAEKYANDFADRRLLTSQGGPRLMLAYALRSSLGITRDPLLVIAPADGAGGKVEFEWIMPRLEKDKQ